MTPTEYRVLERHQNELRRLESIPKSGLSDVSREIIALKINTAKQIILTLTQ